MFFLRNKLGIYQILSGVFFLFGIFLSTPTFSLTKSELNTINIFKRVSSSVVYIKNIKLEYSWNLDPMEIPRGTGSGFVWNTAGYIVTNYHVVAGGDLFLVTLKNQKQYRAKLVGAEPRKDIAVLKLNDKVSGLQAILPGKVKDVQVGQDAIAIGNPFGLDHTMTKGIVSALNRDIPGFGGVKIRGMIQTDAAINQGNSGGPLFNSDGRVIGMNAMIYSPSGTNSGIGFAVPIDTIQQVVPQIIRYGKVIQPGFGITVLPDEFMSRVGIRGVAVRTVDLNGPAAKAGIRGIRQDRYGRLILGDIIVKVNDTVIRNYDDLYTVLDRFKVGQTVKVTLQRGNKRRVVEITLAAI